jgi:hypothetical protein
MSHSIRKQATVMASNDLTELFPEDLQNELEFRFNTLSAAKTDLIHKQRLAQSAAADSQIAGANLLKANVDFLTFASMYSDLAKNETMLLEPRLDGDHHIILECFMTSREQRQMADHAKKQMLNPEKYNELFGDTDDE